MNLALRNCLRIELGRPSLVLGPFHLLQHQQSRFIAKHRIPKWKRQRREKFLKRPLPDFEAVRKLMNEEYTPAEIRAFMRQKGVAPMAKSTPLVCLTESGTVFDPYVPKEGEGFMSGIMKGKMEDRIKTPYNRISGKRALKKFEENFSAASYVEQALEIYIEMHNLLTKVFPRNFLSEYKDNDDYYRLHDLVTEHAWPQVTAGLEDKTLVWKYVESLEPAKIVHYCAKDIAKTGVKFGQVTVRFHSKQIMAVYDRFGRRILGSETVPKDTLDFIVFEKHLSDTLGKWRIHSKLKPDWLQSRQPPIKKTVFVSNKPDDSDKKEAEAAK